MWDVYLLLFFDNSWVMGVVVILDGGCLVYGQVICDDFFLEESCYIIYKFDLEGEMINVELLGLIQVFEFFVFFNFCIEWVQLFFFEVWLGR